MTPHDLVLTPMGLRFAGQVYPCAIGRGGISSAKREGDGATPRGIHRIVAALYRPDRLAPPNAWAAPIRPRDLWCDAPEHPAYNNLVTAPFPASHERLRRADPLYDVVLVTDWNWPEVVPGNGSAIFLHQWRKPHHPTEGCIALARPHLLDIAATLTPGARLIVR